MSDHKNEIYLQFKEDVQYFIDRFEKRAESPGGDKFQTPLDRLYAMKDRLAGLGYALHEKSQSASNTNSSAVQSSELSRRLNDLKVTTIDSIDHVHDDVKLLVPALQRLEKTLKDSSSDRQDLSKPLKNTGVQLERIANTIPDLAADISTLSGAMESRLNSVVNSMALIVTRQESIETRLDQLDTRLENNVTKQALAPNLGKMEGQFNALTKQLSKLQLGSTSQTPAKDERFGQLTHSVRDLEALVRNLLRELEKSEKSPIKAGTLPGGSHPKPTPKSPKRDSRRGRVENLGA
jgi:chromosome segregation ATPase